MQTHGVWDYIIYSVSVLEAQSSFKLYFGGQNLHTLAHLPLLPMEEGKEKSFM